MLFIYFATNIIYEIVTELPLALRGDMSEVYVYTYAALTAVWLLSASFIVWESIIGYTYKLRRLSLFALTALVLTRFVESGIHRHMKFSDWVVLTEGGVLEFLGFTLVCVSFFSGKKSEIYFILSMLWMAQAAFFWAWLLGLPEAGWIEAGWIVPTAFCVVAFGYIGLKINDRRLA